MLRHAVIEKMQTAELKEHASGHRREHVSYLPLPTLGKYTDGRIRRAVIAEPAGGLELPAVRLSELKLFDNASKYVATAVRVLKSDGVFDQYLMEVVVPAVPIMTDIAPRTFSSRVAHFSWDAVTGTPALDNIAMR